MSVNFSFNILVGLLTLTAIDGLGGYESSQSDDEQIEAQKLGCAVLYFIFAVITVITLIFIVVYVPETKGRTGSRVQVQSTRIWRLTMCCLPLD